MKRIKIKGRKGKAPSPYYKYTKTPHRYSAAYYAWKASITRRAEKAGDAS